MSVLEEKTNNIEILKQTLETLPKDKPKDKEKYEEYVRELLTNYQRERQDIITEIVKRCTKLLSLPKDNSLQELETQINKFDKTHLLDTYKSPLEKLKLDVPLYSIEHFYKTDLIKINQDILTCLKVFDEAQIKYQFSYSPYAKTYIESLTTSPNNIEDVFKEIYDKCPDIITHIELNLKSLYYKNKKELEKSYEAKAKEKTLNDYYNLLKQKEATAYTSPQIIVEDFTSGILKTKDFLGADTLYQKYNFDTIEKILNLYHDLIEFKGYLKCQYIADDVKKRYSEKEKNKDLYTNKLKEIFNKEKKLDKLNKTLEKGKKKKLFASKQKSAQKEATTLLQINNLILELKTDYDEAEKLRTNEKIATLLTDESSLYDAILLGTSLYDYQVALIKENNPGIEQTLVYKEMQKVQELVFYPYISTINNISITSDKNIAMLISDKYKLLNIPLDIESLETPDTLEKIIEELYIIIVNESIKTFDFTIKDIDFFLQANKTIPLKKSEETIETLTI